MKQQVVAFDLGGHNLRAARVDQNLIIQQKTEQATSKNRALVDILQQIQSMYQHLVLDHEPLPISLCVPGFVKKDQSIAYAPNFPDWKNIAIKEILAKRLQLDVTLCNVLNDANAALLAEQALGHAKDIQNCIYICIGTGIGGAALIEGQLLHGHEGMACEMGHMSIDFNGPDCGCGNQGCIERYVSTSAIQAKYQQDPKVIADQAREGNPQALKIYAEMGQFLGIAIASWVYVFNPQRILLGGRVSRSMDLFIEPLNQELGQRLRFHPGQMPEILKSHLDDDAGMLGAAVNYFNQSVKD